ncbi:LysR family transcriptional regulator [Streptomyces sp. SID4985]|uniref:LysR family transcriptional regulator n=1 Tax=Streptomyces sp. SID4985 TaxID=2690292 RepID=UPI001368EB4F|nr:LysR family transcriptional regulator [Streptomyces sp. SID4985]MYQ49475.1 LysR family transcriptional regulator [Streptomyces sp. SID4985]
MDLLAHLAAYAATADEASFSRAADRLGIAQPLLSRRIKTLEAHFGGQLFDRSHRQVTVTDFGMSLLPYARDVLERAERLEGAARSARTGRVRAVGVPPDCAPVALARVIRAGAEHGMTLSVRELTSQERELGIIDGSLTYALTRVAPERAALRVPLGLASAPGSERRVVHLEDLRPRRKAAASRTAALPLLTLAEDEVPDFQDRLTRAVARAGLPERLVGSAGPAATALAETLAGRATLLCAEPFAARHGASWAPLADASLHRGYDLRASERGGVPDWLARTLAATVGAVRRGTADGGAAARVVVGG